MKRVCVLFFLLTTFAFSQREYEFDYLIEYNLTIYNNRNQTEEHTNGEKNITKKNFYLFNSKNNDYHAVVIEFDSVESSMTFVNKKDLYVDVKFKTSGFDEAEFIDIDCRNIRKNFRLNNLLVKKYDIFKLEDTIIDGKAYGRFKKESIKPKRTKRRKLGVFYYLIDREVPYGLPVLDFATAHAEWKNEVYFHHGVFYERYLIDYDGHLLTREKLVNIRKIDKKIVIPDECF